MSYPGAGDAPCPADTTLNEPHPTVHTLRPPRRAATASLASILANT